VEKFMQIWGVGSAKANEWYNKGRRDIEDLASEKLSNQQKVGIRYLEELQQKIPRAEVTEIANAVEKVLKKKYPNVELCFCGSYRRGAKESGDIDVLISFTDEEKPRGMMRGVVDTLMKAGIVTDDPVLGSVKFMGIAKAPSSDIHRRIDIRYIPYESWAAGMLYFTGPKEFNVHMRIMAIQQGYKLNEHGLFFLGGPGEEEKLIPAATEKDIFDALGIPYVKPEDRF